MKTSGLALEAVTVEKMIIIDNNPVIERTLLDCITNSVHHTLTGAGILMWEVTNIHDSM